LGGHGANVQNGVPAAGGIHGAKGWRLAYAIASPYSNASACGRNVRCRGASMPEYRVSATP
jgi:hypothetical protein